MNKISLFKFEILSTIFIFILGILLHFMYDWSNNNVIIGLFSSINESTWEHLKLLFYPMVITSFVGYLYYRYDIPNYFCSKVKGIIISLLFTIVFYYTYTGILGFNIDFLNISTFFIAAIIGECYSYKLIKDNINCNNNISIIVILILSLLFGIFTFYHPDINLFRNPLM